MTDPSLQASRAVRLLSNGDYGLIVMASGTSFSGCKGLALTPWTGDPLHGEGGFFVYLRDPEDGAYWSFARHPTPPSGPSTLRSEPGRVELTSLEHGIEAQLEMCVAADADVEIRRVVLRNTTATPRRIELTTYLEVVLANLAAHTSHPTFSKLFVQTDFVARAAALLARRRPRSSGEQFPYMVHALLDHEVAESETDRARFLGRCRSVAAPLALATNAPLSGTTGNVLDPILSLRCIVPLPPFETTERTFLLGCGEDRDAALALVERLRSPGAVDAVFEAAAAKERRELAEIGVDPAEVEYVLDTSVAAEHAKRRASAPAVHKTDPDSAAPERAADQGFTSDGREYVIHLQHEGAAGLRVPPRPWINVLANEQFGCLVSETGAGFTWSGNSREHRLTPWSNDTLRDPHSEAFYIRDDKTDDFWSPLPGPVPAAADYEVRHGFGSSTWRHLSHGLEQEALFFVPREDPVRIVRLRIRNASNERRRLSIFGYAEIVVRREKDSFVPIRSSVDAESGILTISNEPARGPDSPLTIAAVVTTSEGAVVRATPDRDEFFGETGSLAEPAAVQRGLDLENPVGASFRPCAAHQIRFELDPGELVETSFLLGEAGSESEARLLVGRYPDSEAIDNALREVRSFWDNLVGAVRVETPSPAIDLVVNGWLLYQTLACRIWARSAAYQSGGAWGFRDQLQDASALVHAWPERTRAQILLHAAHQFVEGDVLHWWHPPHDLGLRTRFADDLLWLPYLTAFYVRWTGDQSILDEQAPFLTARLLEPEEDEALLQPEGSGESGDLYMHCCRAIDRSLGLGVGTHGLPLFGSGDWNDGMNRVGREGRGESVWMGFFLYAVLQEFLPLCAERHDSDRIRRYEEHCTALRDALESAGWDGEWYRRGYYDDGEPLGSSQSDECRIDLLVQAWAVLSGVATRERALQAVESAERHLVSESEGLIRLLTPPFRDTPHDPGYIKGYVAGVRENGGQYTHASLWFVRALAQLGRNDRAARLLEMLSPVSHTRSPEQVAVYQVEPYVVAADVYGEPPHVGRGGWTWYTGSAGWMYRVALESILGLEIEAGKMLVLRPCVPDDWPRFEVDYRIGGGATKYEIRAENPSHSGRGVRAARLDGVPVPVEDGILRIRIAGDDRTHRLEVELGWPRVVPA